jgi:serine/threonine protein kinase
MARVIDTPSGGGFVGPFEPAVFERLKKELPNDYLLIPNFQIKQRDHDALEYDLVVIAPHAIYVIEEKEWYGRLTGDDQEWLLNQTPRKPPLWLTNTKAKVLKSALGALGNQMAVVPMFIVPDGTQILLGGNWAPHVRNLNASAAWLKDSARAGHRASDISRYHDQIVKVLTGRWIARTRQGRRRVGGYEIVETLFADEQVGEYIAKRAHLDGDPARFRVRTWRLDRTGTPQAVEKRRAIIRRPTEALAKIGRHPNLLPVLQFDFLEDENEFYEVTEWSEYGTLHGFLHNPERDQLTLRERLEIAAGVAAALVEVHAHSLVHRNVCPEAIVVGFDRQPRLTDFDRAYIEGQVTVFEDTANRRNLAFVPPELENPTDYDFDAASDMYSFGALLYQLLTGRPPFLSPTEARVANGRPAKLPSEMRQGVDPRLDELVVQLLRTDDFSSRVEADKTLAVLKDVLGLTTGPTDRPPSAPTGSRPVRFEPGGIIDGVWRVDAELGAGTFSKVYRVFHLDHQKTYAMKLLTSLKDQDLSVHEWNDANKLPPHPNLARVIWMDRLAPPEHTPYVLYEFIDGETLEPYCDGRKHLAWPDVQQIGCQLLDGLAAVHLAGVLHRDLKPANVLLELPTHKPKLIDFNIATFVGDTAGRAGTPRYWAPDGSTQANADLFSLGIVLYELVLQRHPFPKDNPEAGPPYRPNDLLSATEQLSSNLDDFLFRAVQPKSEDRFQSAAEMRLALERVEAKFAPRQSEKVGATAGQFPGLTVQRDEATRPNYNPYVTRLLTLYSQARMTNSGTRGLDEIARLTYVSTRLDQRLAPKIASGSYRLVIITGNAGDGKTAFLQNVEKAFQDRATVHPLPSKNGSQWNFEGVDYETNYDGSQDEGDRANDDVLAEFLAPFEGEELSALAGSQARLIAINEGRLLDFLAHSAFATNFRGLQRFVHEALIGKSQPSRALLVNLNLRAVTAHGDDSLVERQLQAMLNRQLWQPCELCAYRGRCPIKHNVDTLGDDASGYAVRQRVRRLFELVHLRRRAHVTMRDLRSALSWMLLRDNGCDDVSALLARTDTGLTDALASLYYSEAFADHEEAPQGSKSARVEDERAIDRLVRRLREADVGLVNLPPLDRRLDHAPLTAVPWMTFEGRSEHAAKVFDELWRSTPAPGDERGMRTVVSARRALLQRLRRRAFFERRDEGWTQQVPYRAAAMLERIIVLPAGADRDLECDKLRDAVVDAISLSEGLRNARVRRRFLALRVTRIRDAKVRSYRLFAKEDFRVRVPQPVGLVDHLEFAPDEVELVSERGAGHARLRISLDLLEMLQLIRSGYRPTTADLQGLFVNLLIFRNELLATHFDRLLVTPDDQVFYEIRARGSDEGIELAIAPQDLDLEEVST